jgi:DNA (cytosine-5)-methyltransferase 1
MDAKSIELFAGAGGLALGLEQSGFSTRALVEMDEFCCQTLRQNASRYFPKARVLKKDITKLAVSDFLRTVELSPSEIELVAAGPPCQSFSISKIPKGGRSSRDPRDRLPFHFVRFVRRIRPRMFVFENVPGLLSKSKGRVFNELVRSLRSLGYNVNYDVLNAADYGVPQIRKRLFVVGSLDSEPIQFPHPTHAPAGNGNSLPPYITIGETLLKLTPNLPNQRLPKNTLRKKKLLARMRPGSEWKHWRHRDSWEQPSRCITGHCRDDWIHPVEPRAATVRELAALQTFPNDYVFCGPFNAPNNSEFQFQYKQVGNSVPVGMARAIGKSLIRRTFQLRRGHHRNRQRSSYRGHPVTMVC